ncbi:MAG: 1-(5-phosphoribosyl)-5-[(5-phosphoribosylamino)methylideneamino]imidazole-4-carboxamide isomerase [Bacteroidota bacterium]
MEIIPAIDLIDGKCVRLTKGDYDQKKIYNEDPLEVAKSFEDAGIGRLHLVDLDGAKAKKIINAAVLERIATNTSLKIDFGGGVQSDEAIEQAFSCGAQQVTGGSIAVKKPELFKSWLKKYGTEKIILGADVLDKKIATSGWQEINEIDVTDFIADYQKEGVSYVVCTDISKDGVLQGPSTDLYKELMNDLPDMKLIASGGVTTIEDLRELQQAGVYGAIIGKAIYENRIPLASLKEFL